MRPAPPPATVATVPNDDDLASRLTALEHQVRLVSQDAAAARVLAGGADRDVTEIRGEIRDFRQATTASFNAMREDLTDLRQRFDTMERKVDDGFTEMRGRLDATAAGLDQIAGLLTTLINQQPE